MYKLVLGLEIHIQPKTRTKMFCRCDADIWHAEPNSHTCPVCLGLPGALPVPNKEAVEKTHLLGLALGCEINKDSKFDRKHYFYPDLPKGYQISQYKQPVCGEGSLKLDNGFVAQLERIHIEEDTAKSFHQGNKTLVDFNKSGMPLIEIVTTPCFKNVEDASEFAKQVRNVVRLLGISEADMEKGQMRIEPNISVRTEDMEKENKLPNYKVEIKNINSFRFMEKAVQSEMERQIKILEEGGTLKQENRGYDEVRNITVSQRSKEEAKDYRYFPEPDIPPMQFSNEYINDLKSKLPELPWQTKSRLQETYKLNPSNVKVLVDNFGQEKLMKFDDLVNNGLEPNKAINILLNRKDLMDLPVSEIISKINDSTSSMGNKDELFQIVKNVIANNSKAVQDFKLGKLSSVDYLLGTIMRETKGKADPVSTKELILEELNK